MGGTAYPSSSLTLGVKWGLCPRSHAGSGLMLCGIGVTCSQMASPVCSESQVYSDERVNPRERHHLTPLGFLPSIPSEGYEPLVVTEDCSMTS
jgi:hypothetical protein